MSGVGRVVVIASLVLGPTAMTAGDSVSLPLPRPASAVSVEEALASRRSVRDFADAGLSLEDMAQLLWAAQGIADGTLGRCALSAGGLPRRRQGGDAAGRHLQV